MNRIAITGAAAAALLTGGCVDTVGSLQTRPTASAVSSPSGSSASPASWRTPAQIFPVATQAAGGEDIVTVSIPQAGEVRGTRAALATLGAPLEAAPGRNRTVEACRAVAWGEAQKLGAREIEAVSAGPDRSNGKGGFVGPVRLRITYARPNGYEVRLADMTCVVDSRGRIVDAHV
jgi:hypothetical protein